MYGACKSLDDYANYTHSSTDEFVGRYVFLIQVKNTTKWLNICRTNACIELSGSMLSKISNQYSPCDNFYRYACGNWLKHTYVPKGEIVTSASSSKSTKMIHFFRGNNDISSTEKNRILPTMISSYSCFARSVLSFVFFAEMGV